MDQYQKPHQGTTLDKQQAPQHPGPFGPAWTQKTPARDLTGRDTSVSGTKTQQEIAQYGGNENLPVKNFTTAFREAFSPDKAQEENRETYRLARNRIFELSKASEGEQEAFIANLRIMLQIRPFLERIVNTKDSLNINEQEGEEVDLTIAFIISKGLSKESARVLHETMDPKKNDRLKDSSLLQIIAQSIGSAGPTVGERATTPEAPDYDALNQPQSTPPTEEAARAQVAGLFPGN